MHSIIRTDLLQLNKFEIHYHETRQHGLVAAAAAVLGLLAGRNSAQSRAVSLSPVCARPATSGSEFPSLPRANTAAAASEQSPGEQCFIMTRVPGCRVYRFNIPDKGMNLERCSWGQSSESPGHLLKFPFRVWGQTQVF